MLGYAIWERRFNRDPKIVGTSLIINDEPHTVVGVLPASFDFATIFAPGSRFDLYFPFPLSPETNRWGNTMAMIGRLKPASRRRGRRPRSARWRRRSCGSIPERNNFEGFVKPLSEHVSGNIRLAAWVLAGAVGDGHADRLRQPVEPAARAHRRAAEGSRDPHGARRRTEAAARADAHRRARAVVHGAILGLVLAVGGTRLLTALDAVSIPLLRDVRTDGAALAFTVIVALVTGIVFGLAPALQASGVGMTSALKDASRGSTEGRDRAWVRNALVVSEIAFACVLLVGAGLLIRSLVSVLDVKMGFEPARARDDRVDPDSRSPRPRSASPIWTTCCGV